MNPNSLPDSWDNNYASDPTRRNHHVQPQNGQPYYSQPSNPQPQPQPQPQQPYPTAFTGGNNYGQYQQPQWNYGAQQQNFGGNVPSQFHDQVQEGQVNTSLGVVMKVGLDDPVPAGWRILTFNEGIQIKEELMGLMDEWSIVAFDKGKLEGPGYGYRIVPSYGEECGEKFIIRSR